MTQAMIAFEPLIRMISFVAVFAAMAVWELCAPLRSAEYPRSVRWPGNLGLMILNTAVARLVLPTTAVGLAIIVERNGWGLLHAYPKVPEFIAVLSSVVLLDLAIYLQHVLFHYVPALWRLHRMHHADLHVDATTGLRFHTLEILLSFLIKFTVIVALGAPAAAVLIFEVLLSATSIFNHANVTVPLRIETWLRWIVVTPDMHRVHHSARPEETNSNFGFCLPWWDQLLGTYCAQPRDGHQQMRVGIEAFRTGMHLRLDKMLTQPFRHVEMSQTPDTNIPRT